MLLVPTKSYIWGWITGVLTILIGILYAYGAAVSFHVNIDMNGMSVDEAERSRLIEFSLAALVCASGVLIILKKALGWYLLYLMLFLLGAGFFFMLFLATFQFIVGEEIEVLFIGMFSVPTAFFFILLWIQVRYWRSRRALL